MSDPAPPKRRNLPPTRRKREVPSDAAHQLLLGRPSPGLEEEVWRSLNHPSQDGVDRYGANRFELVRYIREVALRLEKLARVRGWQPGPFNVSIDGKGNQYIDVRPAGLPVLDLFTRFSLEKAAATKVHYSDCDFHPHFSVFFEMLQAEHSYEIAGSSRRLGEIADRYFNFLKNSQRPFLNDSDIYRIRDALNSCFTDLYKLTRNAREKVKSFRRVAQENRRSSMQYAAHLIARAPSPAIAHLTIRRDINVVGGGLPPSRDKIAEFRQKFVCHIKERIPEGEYLGYSILLKGDAILGHWLEAFVFLSSNAAWPASNVVAELVGHWNGHVSPGSAGCIGEMLAPGHARPELLYQKALERITCVTETDFYCRVPAMGRRRFWCSQSPVGKLAERTKQNNRREAEKKRAADAESSPIDRLLQMKLTDLGIERIDRWTSKRDRYKERISTKRKKAAKKRTSRKSAATGTTASSPQTEQYAASHAHTKSASEPLADPVLAIPPAPVVTSAGSEAPGRYTSSASVVSPEGTPENTSLPGARTEAEAHAPSAAATPIPSHPIGLQRKQKEITESDNNRERTRVEIRKKRSDPSRKPANKIPDQ